MAKDPICGMYVEEGNHALQTTRYGTTYYFCSETCLAQFQAPEKTLARLKQLVALGAAFTIPIVAYRSRRLRLAIFCWFVQERRSRSMEG